MSGRSALAIAALVALTAGPVAAGPQRGGWSLFEEDKQALRAAPKVRRSLPTYDGVLRSVPRGFVHPRLRRGHLVHERDGVGERVVWAGEGGWATVLRIDGRGGPRALRVMTQASGKPLPEEVREAIDGLGERYRLLIPRMARARRAGMKQLVRVDYLPAAIRVDPNDRPTLAEFRAGHVVGLARYLDDEAEIDDQLAALRRTSPGLREDEISVAREFGELVLEEIPRFDVIDTGFVQGGRPLGDHIRRLADAGDPARTRRELEGAARALRSTMRQLRRHRLAHGDLTADNIFIRPGQGGRVDLTLIDYDGAWSPEVAHLGPANGGNGDYQHPGRGDQFDADLDNFSAAVLYLSLIAIADDPRLFEERSSGMSPLLTRDDLQAPADARSQLAALVARDDRTGKLARRLVHYLGRPARETPPLDTFIREALGRADERTR